ncbi:hypothetical protein PCANC_26632 [Puccinia coronata f. sp. avenae]|uniref:Uncharacterized protein n=1 Tax=Puccinia coronata f. sp. avenae TaxID=200324 RepID=A0A2N5TL77_9BASI|nr:hypothetical protein PCANC_26632 [Puccinia coronata f. sp. avenae]
MILSHWNPVKQVASLDRSPSSPVRQACLTSVPVKQASLTVPVAKRGHPAWRLVPFNQLGDPARQCWYSDLSRVCAPALSGFSGRSARLFLFLPASSLESLFLISNRNHRIPTPPTTTNLKYSSGRVAW